MTKWEIKNIKNKNSKYDFRLISNNKNDYSKLDFFKHSFFRILVSLSSYLTNGIILSGSELYQIKKDKNIPAIFNFEIIKYSGNKDKVQYFTLNDNISKLVLNDFGMKYNINVLTIPDANIFASLFVYDEVNNLSNFLNKNKNAYKHVNLNMNQLYIVTGWLNNINKYNYLILDLLKYDKKYNKIDLVRCKIFDTNILKSLNNFSKNKGYCLFLVDFISENEISIEEIISVTLDEYITYIYDLMLPYKYDFNEENKNKSLMKVIEYKNNDIERVAFAIDPDGSKDRDDAISAFYLNDNKITYDIKNATHIKLIVHISDTLQYVSPKNNNYYYHYCRHKCNTDYLDKYNLPMMDRILSEDILSLDGNSNSAITLNITYRIIDNDNFLIKPFPENVKIHRSKNIKVIGTTYKKFSESFGLKRERYFGNNNFIKRFIINCNSKLVRDFNTFIYEGSSNNKESTGRLISNNLKQLYIYFVNSLNHTGRDTLIKIPSNFVREKISGRSNIFLDFSPVDMWSHTLVEYTALESNIYFSYLMYLISKNMIRANNNSYSFDYKIIHNINELVGNKNKKLLLDNVINNKVIKRKKCGIYRNLYTHGERGDNIEYYINNRIKNILVKIYKREKTFKSIIEIFLSRFKYKVVKDKSNYIIFLKLLMAMRQILLLIKSKTHIDITNKLISKDLIMKAKYDFFPFSHVDISSIFYTHATSPMRRFIDINVHNFVFNRNSEKYIYNKLELDVINKSVNIGKYIHSLVNNKLLIEFIENNKKIVVNADIIDKRRKMIGLIELVNFYSFNETFNLKSKINKVLLELDDYDIIKLKRASKKDKIFNIFFHMLKKEKEQVKSKCKIFLEKIFNVKKANKIC
jgi:hypothetical protein